MSCVRACVWEKEHQTLKPDRHVGSHHKMVPSYLVPSNCWKWICSWTPMLIFSPPPHPIVHNCCCNLDLTFGKEELLGYWETGGGTLQKCDVSLNLTEMCYFLEISSVKGQLDKMEYFDSWNLTQLHRCPIIFMKCSLVDLALCWSSGGKSWEDSWGKR